MSNLITFNIIKNEGGFKANMLFDNIIYPEIREKVDKFVIENIMSKLANELIIFHEEKNIPVLNIFLDENGIMCSSLYLGFLSKELKRELEEIITKEIVECLKAEIEKNKKY